MLRFSDHTDLFCIAINCNYYRNVLINRCLKKIKMSFMGGVEVERTKKLIFIMLNLIKTDGKCNVKST